MLQHLRKNEAIETIERAIAAACDLGVDVRIFIIVGTTHETGDRVYAAVSILAGIGRMQTLKMERSVPAKISLATIGHPSMA